MKVIDLTLPMYTGMPVYPGDPEASIELIQTIPETGWNMRRIEINSHDGTHVNTPIHCVPNGKHLDDYGLASFMGPAKIYKPNIKIDSATGVVFRDIDITAAELEWVLAQRPHFVGLASEFEIDTAIEKVLLEHDVMLFERLANTRELPDEFYFYGVPLKLTKGDGSPVRAFAIVE